ncbi:hypothetical protein GCM10025777_58650 [Membranihabitans marinus]
MIISCGGSKSLKSKSEFSPEAFEDFFLSIDHIEMSGKLRISLPDDGMSYSSTVTTRMNSDSIWILGKFIGFEAFRALVTHDSIQVINRLNKEYMKASWKEVQNKYSKDLEFFSLRNLLLGNPFIVQGKKYELFKNQNVYEFDYSSSEAKLFIDILYEKTIVESSWLIEGKGMTIESGYLKYNNNNLKNIPYFRYYIANFPNAQNINIELEIKNFSFDDNLKLPFEVPSRYTVLPLVTF